MPNRIKAELIMAIEDLGELSKMLQRIADVANEGADNPEKAHEVCKEILQILHELTFT